MATSIVRPKPARDPREPGLVSWLERAARKVGEGATVYIEASQPLPRGEDGKPVPPRSVYLLEWQPPEPPAAEVAAELMMALSAEAELTHDPQLYDVTATRDPDPSVRPFQKIQLRSSSERNAGGLLAPRTPLDEVARANRHAEAMHTIARTTLSTVLGAFTDVIREMRTDRVEDRSELRDLRATARQATVEKMAADHQAAEDKAVQTVVEGRQRRRNMIADKAVAGLGKLAPQLGRKLGLPSAGGGLPPGAAAEAGKVARGLVTVYGKLSDETIAKIEADLSEEDRATLEHVITKAAELAQAAPAEPAASSPAPAKPEGTDPTRH